MKTSVPENLRLIENCDKFFNCLGNKGEMGFCFSVTAIVSGQCASDIRLLVISILIWIHFVHN